REISGLGVTRFTDRRRTPVREWAPHELAPNGPGRLPNEGAPLVLRRGAGDGDRRAATGGGGVRGGERPARRRDRAPGDVRPPGARIDHVVGGPALPDRMGERGTPGAPGAGPRAPPA